MHNILFYNKFIVCLYMFRALCAHHQEVKIVLYSVWYHHTCRWPSGAHVERREKKKKPSLNLRTGWSPTGVMIPDAVYRIFSNLIRTLFTVSEG